MTKSAKWNTRDLCQKHVDNGSLFTSIRYHSVPFAAPPTAVNAPPEVSQKDVLEIEVAEKFQSGNYRLVNVLTVLGMLIKPLFLGCILPLYCGFYVLPVWIFHFTGKWVRRISGQLGRHFYKLKSLAVIIFAPIYAVVSKAKNLIKRIQLSMTTVTGIFKRMFFKSRKRQPSHFVFLKNWCLSIVRWKQLGGKSLKDKFSQCDRGLRRICYKMKTTLGIATRDPSIYFRQLFRSAVRCFESFVKLPVKKMCSWVLNWKQKISTKINAFCSAIKKKLTQFQGVISLKYRLTVSRLTLKIAPLKTSAVAYMKRFEKFVKALLAMFKRSLPNIRKVADGLSKPKQQFARFKKVVSQYKRDVREFAIHLPGRVKEQIPVVLNRFNDRLLIGVKALKQRKQALTKGILRLIPAPLWQLYYRAQIILMAITKKLGFCRSFVKEKFFEVAFLFLLFRIWSIVILRHAKQQVVSHRFVTRFN